ncbi:elongation factor P [Mariprofundus ferrinatatus]|uniref:Elongation factor P n=1 Tax=Mariprofundus ferrinatatus TaxID=1921087 RepID=A0A2K8L572_9PROT|nr:elongation factor P [Mariprofundus ferrinatatus]ATX82465.1 elongation factor P [Mariprofundus ferrinatatus]
MQMNVTSVRVGNILEIDNGLWRVMKATHVTPGKGVACMQLEMRNVETGTKTNKRFNSSERVERAVLSQRDMQYLYADGDDYHFMDMETYDQITLNSEILEDALAYLLPEMMVQVEFHEDRPLNVKLPQTVVLEVIECDAALKGQTATSSYKPGRLETGASIMVPPYLESGTRVKVNTETGEFVERA